MSANVKVLAHYQPLDARQGTHVPAEVAEVLVRRMAAERISHRLIRMFDPRSVFNAAHFPQGNQTHTIDGKLPPREVNGTYFKPPQSSTWRLAHRMVVLPHCAESSRL